MSLALYRKYRPGRFADVVGQEQVTGPLVRALRNDRVHHAYLFSGPRGCGKTSSARILARSLNCVEGPTPEPCGVCQPCIDLAPNGPGSIDVVEIDAATHRSVENARDLRDAAAFAPVSSRYTIYIIDEAHQLTKDAGNALLKLIEEPPAHLRFVFATTEPEKILGTVRSRTHHYAFRLVAASVLRDHLAHICELEGVPADPAALALVARAAEGSVRDSLSLLGQLVASAEPGGITYADAVELIGVTEATILNDVVAAIQAQDAATLFTVVERVITSGQEPRRFATDVLDRLRDILVVQAMPDASERGVVDVPEDQVEDVRAQAQQLTAAEATRAAELVNEGLSSLRGATAPRLTLEILCARLALPQTNATDLDLLARIDRVERRTGELAALGVGALAVHPHGAETPSEAATTGRPTDTSRSGPHVPAETTTDDQAQAQAAGPSPRPTRPAATPRSGTESAAQEPARSGRTRPRRLSELSPTSAPTGGPPAAAGPSESSRTPQEPTPDRPAEAPATPTRPHPPTDGDPTLAQVQALWPAVVDAVKTRSRVAWIVMSRSSPLSVVDGTIVAAVPDAGSAAHFRRTPGPEIVREALLEVMKRDLRVDVVPDGDRAAAGNASKSAPAGPGESTTATTDSAPAARPEPASTGRPPTTRPTAGPGHGPAARPPAAQDRKAEEEVDEDALLAESSDATSLTGIQLVEAELGAVKIAEFED